MKNFLKIAAVFALIFMIVGCTDKTLVKEEMPDLSDVVPDGINPIQHQKHLFYKDYGIFMLDKFDESDYKFSMGTPIKETIEPIKLDQNEKLEVITFLREAIYDKFPVEFIRQYFPVKLLLASRIYIPSETSTDYDGTDHLFSNSVFAVRANRDFINEIRASKDSMRGIFNSYVILNLLDRKVGEGYHEEFEGMLLTDQEKDLSRRNIYFGPLNPPDIPLEVELPEGGSRKQAPADFEFSEFPLTREDQVRYAYEQGFPNMIYMYNVNQYGKFSFLHPDGTVEELESLLYKEYGKKYDPLYNYMEGEAKMSLFYDYIPMFTIWAQNTPEPEKSQILAQYPLLKQRYDVFRAVIKKHLNLDL